MSLRGDLEKWTNYWAGWQTRYFILEDGVLSYYHSEEEVLAGARAQIRVQACDILPDPVDQSKFDLTVGSGQKFSLRAPTTAMRQTWLIALGSAKQETEHGALKAKRSGDQAEKMARKSTELRLYCDLLVQQVDTIQQGIPEENRLTENAMMLDATCKTFLKTLKDTMTLINDNIKEPEVPLSPTQKRVSRLRRTPSTTSLPIGLGQEQRAKSHKRTNSNSTQFSIGSLDMCPNENGETKSLHSLAGAINESLNDSHDDEPEEEQFADAATELKTEVPSQVPEVPSSPTPPPKRETFFTTMQYSFEGVLVTADARTKQQQAIPTKQFLDASGDFLPILDKLGSKAFQPVKMDISGNIGKIRTKFETNEEKFNTLQAIVLDEKATNTSSVANSATDAIMWLKRGLTFVKEFLKNVTQGEQDLTKALQDAYTSSLARHHGWVVRGVFHLAVKAAPYYGDFLEALLYPSTEKDDETIAELMDSLKSYHTALERLLDILDEFYRENKLESSKLI